MSEAAFRERNLPVGSIAHKSFGWWGMMTLIMTEASLFAYLLFAYYYFMVQYGREWISETPTVNLSLPNTAILLLSSVFVWWGEKGAKKGRQGQQASGLASGVVLGTIFIAIQVLEWRQKAFTLASSSYGSSFFVTTGFHMAHVAAGVLMLAAVFAWSLLGYFDARRNAAISIAAVYWHFVDLVWLAIFFTFYITPHMG
ncbi:cytochrome c oxidase subunit 3 [Methylocystis sp. JAN1]|uniref:cytochrome c oxidase subunit 3 n=1 Tax=Methylocystis sp. JAN1 TaxID=3397211 RepID=UPI003FA1D6E4